MNPKTQHLVYMNRQNVTLDVVIYIYECKTLKKIKKYIYEHLRECNYFIYIW